MPRLALYLLGPPRVECNGVAIRLDRRKSLALLAYLATTGQSHRRDALVNLLWPDYDTPQGRAALRRTLHALNASLGGDSLAVDRDEIGLGPGDGELEGGTPVVWVDVVEFRRHLAACRTHGHPTSEICSACPGPLAAAAALAGGEFLSGFSLKDSANFDDWQMFHAEALRQELADALGKLVRWHTSQRQFEPAISFSRRRLALDPLDETAHQELMRLYAWSGRRSAALRQYEECAVLLKGQLGVPPQDATRRLHDEIQAGRAPALVSSVEHAFGVPPVLTAGQETERPVFVAREPELSQLDQFLKLALAGKGCVAMIAGEAGSGKTALIQEFSRRAIQAQLASARSSARPRSLQPEDALVVVAGNCNAYTGIGDPYLPFREILALLTGDVEPRWAAGAMTREHARRLWLALPLAVQAIADAGPDLVDLFVSRASLLERVTAHATGQPDWLTHPDLPAERRSAGAGLPAPQQSDLFEQYTRVLQLLARQLPLVLVVDDLQWADLGSISLLFHLGRHVAGHRIMIVGLYRPEDVAAGRGGERHPLEPVLNELQRSFGEITVNLDRAESQEFVEAFLDSEPNRLGAAFREMLYRQTRGHPLFTIELLRGLQERGDLAQDESGHWIETPGLNWEALPARVEAAIRDRIGRLAKPLQAALRVASVEGEVFTAEVVTRLLGGDVRGMVQRLSDELDRTHRLVRAQAIERLEARRLSRYRFRNYLFQKYLYDSLDDVERAYLHEDVGRVLEEIYAGQASEIAVQLAWHFRKAGVADKAIYYLRRAGERAVRLSAYQEAVTHLTQGLDLLLTRPETPERARQELELRLTLGTAAIGVGRFTPEVAAAYARARDLGQQTGQVVEHCQALGAMAIYHYVRAEHRLARELAREARSRAEQSGDPQLVAWSCWHIGFVLSALGEFAAAHEHLQHVAAFSTPARHLRAFADLPGANAGLSAQAYDAVCLWCLGYPDQALEQSRQALASARELADPFTLSDVLCYGCCVLSEMRRDWSSLQEHAREFAQIAVHIPTWQAPATWHTAEALARLGRLEEGIARMSEGLAMQRTAGKHCDIPRVLGTLGDVQARAGRLREGLAALTEALEMVEKSDERSWEAELYRLQAELLRLAGKDTEAEASLMTAIKVAQRQAARSWELRATTDLARLWQSHGRVAEAREALATIYGWFTEGSSTADHRQAQALLAELS